MTQPSSPSPISRKPSSSEVSLGVAKDVLAMAGPLSQFGFSLAQSGVDIGFRVGRSCFLQVPAQLLAQSGCEEMSASLHGMDQVVETAHSVTSTTLRLSRHVSETSIKMFHSALTHVGVEDGHSARLFLESNGFGALKADTAAALVRFVWVVMGYTEEIPSVGVAKLFRGTRAFAKLQGYDVKGSSDEAQDLSDEAQGSSDRVPCSSDRDQPDDTRLVRNNTIVDPSQFSVFVRFAVASLGCLPLVFLGHLPLNHTYSTDEEAIVALNALDSVEDVVYSKFAAGVYEPAHYVVIDRTKELIVVSMRSTKSVQDVLTDLACDEEDFNLYVHRNDGETIQGRAHGGMLEAAKRLSCDLHATVSTLIRNNPTFQLIVTGHSLGAGVASLLALIWGQVPVFAGARIHCYAFAPPCTVSAVVASSGYARDMVTSIIVGDDVVCRLGIGTMKDLRNAVLRLVKDSEESAAPSDSVMETLLAEEDLDEQRQAERAVNLRDYLKKLRAEEMCHDKLYPAGRAIHIDPESTNEHGKPVGREVPNTFFTELVLSSSMFAVHSPVRYFEACH